MVYTALSLLLAIILLPVFLAGAVAGGMFLVKRLWGIPEGYTTFDLERYDEKPAQAFLLHCLAVGAIGAVPALALGFLLGYLRYFRPHYHQLGLLLALIAGGLCFAAAGSFFKADPRRAAVIAAIPAVVFFLAYELFLYSILT